MEAAMATVYDLLKGLESEAAIAAAKQLFAIAGTFGLTGGGYFFEHKTIEIINNAHEASVLDPDGTVIKTYPTFELALTAILSNSLPPLLEGNYSISRKTTNDEIARLKELREAIYAELIARGVETKNEFAIVAACIGAQIPTDDDIRLALLEAISG